MDNYKLLLIFAVILLAVPLVMGVESETINISKDTIAFHTIPDQNYGTNIQLHVHCNTNAEYVTYILVNFTDLSFSQIDNATLYLFMEEINYDAGVDLEIYYCNDYFNETNLTWNNQDTEVANCDASPIYDDFDYSSTGWKEINITNNVSAEILGDQIFTLKFIMDPFSSPNHYFVASSSNTTNISAIPYIAYVNRTVGPGYSVELNQYNATNVLETSKQDFLLMVEFNDTVANISAVFGYENKTGTRGSLAVNNSTHYIFYKNISLDYTNYSTYGNNDFYWNLTIQKAAINVTNNITGTQNVSNFSLSNSLTNHPSLPFNITIYDEETRSRINATMKMTFDTFITNESMNMTHSFDLTTILGNHSLFSFPSWAKLLTDARMQFNATDYVSKAYYLNNATLSNSTINISIYLLNSSDSSLIFIHVIDQYWNDVDDAVIKVLRYYPETNEYITVEIATTDDLGYALLHLVEEDVDYKFIVENVTTGSVLKQTNVIRILCLESPCILEIILDPTTTVFDSWAPVDGFDYTLYYNNATKTVIFTWDDITGAMSEVRLYVEKQSSTSQLVLCNGTSSSTAGTLSCNLTNQTDGSFLANAYYRASPDRLIESVWIWIETNFTVFGNEGLWWGFALVVTMMLIGLWNPVVSVILGIFGIILLAVLNLVALPWVIIVIITAIALLIISRLKS